MVPTRMTGQRSLAEMYANEVLSDVTDGAADIRLVFLLAESSLRVLVSYSILTLLENQLGDQWTF